jgi:hypothetical protein
MRFIAPLLAILVTVSLAQQATIDLDVYKNAKKYAWAETTMTVGKHAYKFVNVKPVQPNDTFCISAIVIDKRKFVFQDLSTADKPSGLMIPKRQPLKNCLVVLKGSAVEGKAFLIFATGKVVNLPGADLFADTNGTTIYCVWDNDGQFRLTVFDYGAMRLLMTAVPIARPVQWYNAGPTYCFKSADESAYCTVDFFTKSISKSETLDPDAKPVSYLPGFGTADVKDCCSKKMFAR